MKHYLHCHTKNVHSFAISEKDGLLKRVFYADKNHKLHEPFEIAIHPHHTDIKITVLDGALTNIIYGPTGNQVFGKFKWNSEILNGKGGFEWIGVETLSRVLEKTYCKGDSVSMKACEYHTIWIQEGKKCVWLVEESEPSCDYSGVNYSIHDLTKWSSEGLYQECGEYVKDQYLSKYQEHINTLINERA